ncbi:MAG: hypothetical protein OEW04_01530 [Nitrospirota bacterium]|nr:hypothetical protein [Nitrospirota bacterium]
MTQKTTKTNKSSKKKRLIYLFLVFTVLCLVALLQESPRNAYLLTAVLLLGASLFFEVFDRWCKEVPQLFQRLLFYGAIGAISSLTIPIIDVLILTAAGLVFELDGLIKNEYDQEKP